MPGDQFLQSGVGIGHEPGMAHGLEHGKIVPVVSKGSHVREVNAKGLAQGGDAGALVREGKVHPHSPTFPAG